MQSLIKTLVFGLGLTIVSANTAQASLIDRGGGLIYDTDLNITWLANADVNGFQMTWNDAMTWAGNLSYGGYTDWRLPTSDTCEGINCTGSEMGHLFYNELGSTAGSSVLSSGDPDLALFTNIQPFYWSGTEYAPDPVVSAWVFYFYDTGGDQGVDDKDGGYYAWAVHDGDVAAVPVPAAAWLFGSGLLGLIGVVRRKKT